MKTVRAILWGVLFVLIIAFLCAAAVATFTPTITAEGQAAQIRTATPFTPRPTRTLIPMFRTATARALPTNTATNTGTNTATSTVTNTGTNTATSTVTNTGTNTATSTVTNTPTNTGTNTATSTATNTGTNTATSTATNTGTNTATSTVTNTPTNTGTNTATSTVTNTPTNTGTPTITPTPAVGMISSITSKVMSESGLAGASVFTYSVRLTNDPGAGVTVYVFPDFDSEQMTVTPNIRNLNSTSWNTGRNFTITILNNPAAEAYQIVSTIRHDTSSSSTASPYYNQFGFAPVNITIIDAQTPQPTATPTLTPTPIVPDRVWYVSTTGNDLNIGSIAAPYRTINRCVQNLLPSDTCYIRGGTYAEYLDDTIPAGNADDPVTIAAYNGETVLIQPPPGSDRVIYLEGTDTAYIVLDGLTLDGENTTYDTVKITLGAHDITITDSTLINATQQTILCSNLSHHVTIERNHFENNGFILEGENPNGLDETYNHPLYLQCSYVTVRDNTMTNNSGHCASVRRASGDPYLYGAVIENNVCDTAARGILLFGFKSGNISGNTLINIGYDGIQLNYDTDNIMVENNTIINCNSGLYLVRGTGNTFATNTVTNCQRGITVSTSSGNTFLNNVVTGADVGETCVVRESAIDNTFTPPEQCPLP